MPRWLSRKRLSFVSGLVFSSTRLWLLAARREACRGGKCIACEVKAVDTCSLAARMSYSFPGAGVTSLTVHVYMHIDYPRLVQAAVVACNS